MDELKYEKYIRKYDTLEEAEKDRVFYDSRKKVKTDVFRVLKRADKFIIEQDLE